MKVEIPNTIYKIAFNEEELNALREARKVLSNLYDTMKNHKCDVLSCVDDCVEYEIDDIDELLDNLKDLETMSKMRNEDIWDFD